MEENFRGRPDIQTGKDWLMWRMEASDWPQPRREMNLISHGAVSLPLREELSSKEGLFLSFSLKLQVFKALGIRKTRDAWKLFDFWPHSIGYTAGPERKLNPPIIHFD
jgi:hypothetical protein